MSFLKGLGLSHPNILKGINPVAAHEGGGDPILSIFRDGTDGFYFDFSKTDRLFQNVIGTTPADGAGENIALALDGHEIDGRGVVNLWTNFPTGWSQPNALLSAGAAIGIDGEMSASKFIGQNGTTNNRLIKTAPLSAGAHHYSIYANQDEYSQVRAARADVNIDPFTHEFDLAAGTASGGGAIEGVGDGWYRCSGPVNVNTAATTGVVFTLLVAGSNGFTADGVSGLLVDGPQFEAGSLSAYQTTTTVLGGPGNHGLQATTAAQPKWQTGGLARFDGSDDNLLTTLVPGTALTLMAKFKPTTANGLIMGSRGASADSRCYLGTDANGKLGGSVGAHNNTVIFGGSDIRGTIAVGAQTFDGATVKLYLNASEVYSGAQSGAPTLDTAMMLGAVNVIGTASAFMAADAYHFLAIKKALTAAEIAAITNLWGIS